MEAHCRCEEGNPPAKNQESPNCLEFQLDCRYANFCKGAILSGALERLNSNDVLRSCCESLESRSRWYWLGSVDVNAVPVQVIGREDEGAWDFPNLAAAQKQFPELDPYRSTNRFTAAMRGEVNDAP